MYLLYHIMFLCSQKKAQRKYIPQLLFFAIFNFHHHTSSSGSHGNLSDLQSCFIFQGCQNISNVTALGHFRVGSQITLYKSIQFASTYDLQASIIYHPLAQSVLPTTKEKLSCIKHFDISRFGLKMQFEENSVFRQFIYVINKWIKLATLALKLYDHRKKQIGELTTGTMIILSFNKPLLWKMVRKSSCSAASQCCPMLFHD